jgi:predicted chitinase
MKPMKLTKRVPSGREKDQAAIIKLEQLREKVYCDNPSAARHAAFNLSWMQEDGYDILKEALFGTACRATKGAAAYGLRKMRGRMKKNGIALLIEGLKHSNEGTRQVCARALLLEKQSREQASQQPPQPDSQPKFKPRFKPQFKISEISHKSMRERPRSSRENPPHASRFNR